MRRAPLVLACLAAALAGARPAHADAPTDALRRAARLARAGALDDAVAAMPGLDGLTREHWAAISDAAQAIGAERPAAASHLYAALRRLDPDARPPRAALEALWARCPAPDEVDPADIPFLPVDADTLILPACAAAPATRITVLSVKPFLAAPPAREPRTGESFAGQAAVYAGPALRFVVHIGAGVNAERARSAGRFLGALSAWSDRMLGQAGRARYPMAVWLSAAGKPGASQWAGAISVHGAAAARSPLEWARELSHEWGHAALPGASGFSQPEAWANGDLGERIFLPALQDCGWLAGWDPAADAAPYVRRYVDPLVQDFARTGPVAARITDRSRAGFDHFLGAALYVEAAYGRPLLMEALSDMDEATTRGFLDAFRRALERRKEWTVRRVDGPPGGRPICFPAPGTYILRSLPERTKRLPSPTAGWSALDWNGVLSIRKATDRGGPDGYALQVRSPRPNPKQ